MPRPGWGLLSVGLAIMASPGLTTGQSLNRVSSGPVAPVSTAHAVIQASLDRIGARSLLWQQALAAVGSTGRRAAIVTADRVVVTDAGRQRRRRFDPDVLAEVSPVPGPGARVDGVLVVINLMLLEDTHRARGSQPWEFADDLDRILVHEIYGHAVPYLLAGDWSGHCADPRPDERPEDACAIQRENAVRAELGLGRRRDAGLDGLALMRPASR